MKLLRSLPATELAEAISLETVHVAVGRSPEKTLRLLEWTFRWFRCGEVTLVHIHRPSSAIPTLLGNLPVDQANEVLVSAHRLKEWNNTEKLVLHYMSICHRSQVQPKIILVEAEHIQKGIIDVVERHAIRKLVMGAQPNMCFKVKGIFFKPKYAIKIAPLCEMWFVHKGKLVWVREALDANHVPTVDSTETLSSKTSGSNSLQNQSIASLHDSECHGEIALAADFCISRGAICANSDNKASFAGETTSISSPCEKKFSAETSIEEAMFREEHEGFLAATKLKHDELLNLKEEIIIELQNGTKNAPIFHHLFQEMARLKDEPAGELNTNLPSISAPELQNQKIRHQRDDHVQQVKNLKCNLRQKIKWFNKLDGFGDDSLEFEEFSLLDLQAATFGFSDRFMIEEGGDGCVYKGEMFNRSVAVKKFHYCSVQGQPEFQQEVFILSKLRHPNLVTLIGACPEALSLVYEYLPNGNLHDRLFCRNLTPPLPWTTRVRIIAQISTALLFLHSSKPERIVHGDLKLMNIFLDSNLSCKIGGFGLCELVPDQEFGGTSLRKFSVPNSPGGEFPYTDPEYQRTGILTSKSDVYSFGIIVLQLLTGRPPVGLTAEVRRAVLTRQLSYLLDFTAGEWPMIVSEKLAEFGLKCTELSGRNRPEMTPAVVRELEMLLPKQERPVPTSFLCPILQEIMYDPMVAADGFTYEGGAVREWLANGRETSPMTNLELENLNLVPNHALRIAIQDWLCQAFQ